MTRQFHKTIRELSKVLKEMVRHRNTLDEVWMNIPLGKKAIDLFNSLPDSLEGEYSTLSDKATLICNMLEQMEETMTPRFCLSVRRQIAEMDPGNSDNNARIRMLSDYIDESIPMEDWCGRYGRHLKFDPVERTPAMEEIVYYVERQCAELLGDVPRCMGFCFAYWNARRQILSSLGISWKSPHEMNPGVIFD